MILTASALVLTPASCRRDRDVILGELKQLERAGGYEKRDLDRKTEQELLDAVRFLEAEVNRTIDAGTHLGTYYKLVAIKYRDRRMYGPAKEFFEKALTVYPQNPYLAYWTAVCTAQLSRARQAPEEKRALLDEARDYYLYAIELDPIYTDALYGLSVLYVFEYDQPSKAEPYLERVLARESRDYRAMFLLARVYVTYGRIDDAIALYDRIIADDPNEAMTTEAIKNRNELTGGARGR